MRDEQHYRRMLAENPTASINATLAASMVYAARHGICEPEHCGDEWKGMVRRLMSIYGETIDADQVLAEMDEAHHELDGLATLADRFGLEHDQLRRAAGDGRLQARKVAGSWLSSVADVQAALDAGTLQYHVGRPRKL